MSEIRSQSGASSAQRSAPRIAVVDDERNLLDSVCFALERAGYRAEPHVDGGAAWEAFERRLPDLAILDVVMPRVDGLDLCRRLRGRSERLPILFLTSRDDELDRVLGLELGADDYLCKPFSMRELMARVKVLLRRASWGPDDEATGEDVLAAGPLRLDRSRHTATWGGRELRLTVTEFRLLDALATRPGHVRSRAQLLADAYPDDLYVAERTVDTHVKRLRAKLARADAGGRSDGPIETVYGLGYRFAESWDEPAPEPDAP